MKFLTFTVINCLNFNFFVKLIIVKLSQISPGWIQRGSGHISLKYTISVRRTLFCSQWVHKKFLLKFWFQFIIFMCKISIKCKKIDWFLLLVYEYFIIQAIKAFFTRSSELLVDHTLTFLMRSMASAQQFAFFPPYEIFDIPSLHFRKVFLFNVY